MAKLIPHPAVPSEKLHSGLKVVNPHQTGTRILEHRRVALRLNRVAIGMATDRRTAMSLMNMAGDIYCILVKGSTSERMREAYRECASICYQKAALIRYSSPGSPYKDIPTFVTGLKYHL